MTVKITAGSTSGTNLELAQQSGIAVAQVHVHFDNKDLRRVCITFDVLV